MQKRALVLGDYDTATYHSLYGVAPQLQRILADYTLTFLVDYQTLTPLTLQAYDLLILYQDAWQDKGTDVGAGAILAYCAQGGGVLSIHSGIITTRSPELLQLQGGAFRTHPPACALTYTPQVTPSALGEDLEPFTVFEEPYMFHQDPLLNYEVFLTYTYDGETYPAAWVRRFGLGRMIYLSPGHSAQTFADAQFATLVRRCADYVAI